MKLTKPVYFSYFEKASYIAQNIAASYGDAIIETTGELITGRTWDCSYFVARIIRAITSVDNLYKGSAISQAVTHLFLQYCSRRPAIGVVDLPLLFLFDKQDMDFPSHTAHVGIAMPDVDFLSMCLSTTGEVLDDIIVLDMVEGYDGPPRLRKASTWFDITPLSAVRVMPFPGASGPTFGDERFVVSPAFFNVRQALKDAANRG